MALKFKLSAEDFASLDDAIKGFYKQTDDGYQLDAEGATSKDKLDEFRANNVELMKKLDQFKNVDMTKINELMEKERKLQDAQFIEKKDFEGLVESRTKALAADYDGKLKAALNELEQYKGQYNGLLTRHEIEGGAAKAFALHKISPDANDAVMALVKSKFTIDNGLVVAKNGDQIEQGKNGNLTIAEFVGSLPEMFRIPSSGGVGAGGKGAESTQNNAVNSRSLIAEGLAELTGN